MYWYAVGECTSTITYSLRFWFTVGSHWFTAGTMWFKAGTGSVWVPIRAGWFSVVRRGYHWYTVGTDRRCVAFYYCYSRMQSLEVYN